MNNDISIIIPVYNVEKYLKRFISCLHNQTYQNFIAIFIIDKSPDNSLEIIKNNTTIFRERIIIIENKENIGLSKTRNVGLDYVKHNQTRFLTFLDPDDWIEPEYLEDLYKSMLEYDLDLCISGVIRYNDGDNGIICKEMIDMPSIVFEHPGECNQLAYINPCVYAKMFRFELVKEIRIRNVKRSEDTCYLLDTLRVVNRIKFTNRALYHYCVRDTSLTGNMDEDKYESMHSEFKDMVDIFLSESINDIFVAQVYIRSSLGGVCRLAFTNMRKAFQLEKREYEYLNTYVTGWKTNKYLCLYKRGIGGKKELMLKVTASMYKHHIFFIFIWIYYFMVHILKKDVRA